MSTTCPICDETAVNPKKVDVPQELEVCQDCFDVDYWTCDSCHRGIAFPEVEGGESPGSSPKDDEMWCEECRDERLAKCDVCGSDELTEGLTQDKDERLCEICARRYGILPS